MNLKINNTIILFISLVFSLIVGSGFYGFGNDFYAAYYKPNLDWGNWIDNLGWRISTLTIFKKNIGVYIVTFLIAFCFGILLKNYFEFKRKKIFILFLLFYLISLHTWPIIMSTSNAMRQGITMSFIFLSFAYLLKNENLKSFFFIFISVFFHKSGIIFFSAFLYFVIVKIILQKIKLNHSVSIICLLFGIISYYLFFLLLSFTFDLNEPTRIIRGDYRYHFISIFFIYTITFSYYFKLLRENDLILYMYLFGFFSTSLFTSGLNWQYERLSMMIVLPYILIFTIIFKKNSSYFLLFLLLNLLLGLTILNGMYASLK